MVASLSRVLNELVAWRKVGSFMLAVSSEASHRRSGGHLSPSGLLDGHFWRVVVVCGDGGGGGSFRWWCRIYLNILEST